MKFVHKRAGLNWEWMRAAAVAAATKKDVKVQWNECKILWPIETVITASRWIFYKLFHFFHHYFPFLKCYFFLLSYFSFVTFFCTYSLSFFLHLFLFFSLNLISALHRNLNNLNETMTKVESKWTYRTLLRRLVCSFFYDIKSPSTFNAYFINDVEIIINLNAACAQWYLVGASMNSVSFCLILEYFFRREWKVEKGVKIKDFTWIILR